MNVLIIEDEAKAARGIIKILLIHLKPACTFSQRRAVCRLSGFDVGTLQNKSKCKILRRQTLHNQLTDFSEHSSQKKARTRLFQKSGKVEFLIE